MHTDAADFGRGGTFRFRVEAEAPISWEVKGFWDARNRAQPITLVKLYSLRLLLHRHFVKYVSRGSASTSARGKSGGGGDSERDSFGVNSDDGNAAEVRGAATSAGSAYRGAVDPARGQSARRRVFLDIGPKGCAGRRVMANSIQEEYDVRRLCPAHGREGEFKGKA